MSDIETGFLCLMTHPWEPLFYPKYDGETFMDLPDEYLIDRYRPLAQSIRERFGTAATKRIEIKPITLPALEYAEGVARRGDFNLFSSKHRQVAGQLVKDMLAQPDAESLLSLASYARDRVNPTLFQYALSQALLHHKETGHVPVPSFLEMFPYRFVDPLIFPKLAEEGFIVMQPNRVAVDIPLHYTSSDGEVEQRLAYFREDIGLNLHHWHWHLVYPQEGPLEIVDKDRRGELFFYMHRQVIARYNSERLSNGLQMTVPLHNLREPITEAYFPKLLDSARNRTYPGRMKNQTLSHVNRPDDDAVTTILEMEVWLARFLEAAQSKTVLGPNGEKITLDENTGIDILGNIMENSVLSVNLPYYGNYHSLIHSMIGYIHDPENIHLEGHGVLGDFPTAMRDPVFYRLHTHVDDLFDLFKRQLPHYTPKELSYDGIDVADVSVHITSGKAAANRLLTFWQRSQVDLGVGLDFGPKGNVVATFTHLQHAPFSYQIMIHNLHNELKKGTVRIFLAPMYNIDGGQFDFNQQRRNVMELDKFVVNLHPGENRIIRRSDESSVTIPFERTFRRIDITTMPGTMRYRFCNCGWPDHLLLPKGSPDGMPFELFVMVSNYEDDKVQVKLEDLEADCTDSHSYCGLRDQLYPDRRAMGYPFDRAANVDVHTMKDFVQPFANMSRTVVEVRFTNTVIARS